MKNNTPIAFAVEQNAINPVKIGCEISGAIDSTHALRDTNNALFELSNLVATADNISVDSLSSLLYFIHERIDKHLNALENLAARLEDSA